MAAAAPFGATGAHSIRRRSGTSAKHSRNEAAATHSSGATTRVLLGCARARLGQHSSARALWAEAAPLLTQSLGADHPFTQVVRGYLALADGIALPPEARAALREQIGSQAGASEWLAWLAHPPSPLPWARLPVVF